MRDTNKVLGTHLHYVFLNTYIHIYIYIYILILNQVSGGCQYVQQSQQ